MLLPNDRDYLIRKERHEALIRDVELAHLIGELALHERTSPEIYRKLIGQLGSHMVKLGQKLELYGRAASSGKLA